MERGSGLLLHFSSLPGKYGIGGFSNEAKKFVKLLKYAGQKYWQILPMNPTGFKDSPYQSYASFAINPYFIDLDQLKKDHLLSEEEIKEHTKAKNTNRIDYGYLYDNRFILLDLAAKRAIRKDKSKIDRFYKQNRYWIEDYALFMTLKHLYENVCWVDFPREFKKHNKNALKELKESNFELFYSFVAIQYFAFSQYKRIKKYANKMGIKIIGDVPIYVSYDSCDVWANQKQFLLDKDGHPALVAGVPPDYFSKTGQLWGNPIYNYQRMEKTNFKWWVRRIKHASKLYDYIRIDHFRGFASYYVINPADGTALNGKWIEGPRTKIIDAFNKVAENRIIAEDLGILTQDVFDLMDYAKYPGLNIFQFADFSNWNHKYLPHNYKEHSVAYLGTHDNDVFKNFLNTNENTKRQIMDYLKIDDETKLVKGALMSLLASKADVTIFMPQDVLEMDGNVRINIPSEADGNWTFRFKKSDLKKEKYLELYKMCCQNNRY